MGKIKFDWKKNWLRVVGGVLLVLLAIVFVRVLVWEHFYYEEKEGSERAAVVSTPTTENSEVDEAEISGNDLDNYTVAKDHPRFLKISKLGIERSRVLPVSLSSSRQIETPNNIFDTGWYTDSGKPGAGGTGVYDGHNGGPTKTGVFKYLPNLAKGDSIIIERGDGRNFEYQVVENEQYPLEEANSHMNSALVSPVPGRESITLITCSGEWSDTQKTYLSRQFVKAILVN
ncbi:class F sortase [Candidatus Saccharibacteria bacterium]|nr:class F sortase [Candidatus Saccharibacteria bacterium]